MRRAALLLGLLGGLAGCASLEERWEEARAADTPAAYEEFLRQHPGGDLAEQARSRLRDLREEEAWQVAHEHDTRAAYEDFLRRYHEGRRVAAARERLIALLAADLTRTDLDARGRADAASGLVQLGGAAVPALLAVAEAGDPVGRRELVSALVRIARVTLEPVQAGLGHPAPAVRAAVAEVLGAVGDRRSLVPLAAALRDEHAEVRQAASAALTRLDGAGDALLAALRDRDPRARGGAAIALGRLREARAIRPLIGLLTDADAEVRQSAAAALAVLGQAAGPSLITALADADARLRRGAAEVLGAMAYVEAIEPLVQRLADPEPDVRAGAQDALHRLSLRLLADLRLPGEARRRAAVAGLARIGPPVAGVLLATLREADPALRRGAAEALGQMREPRAASPLVELLGDPDRDVQQAAAEALGRLGAPSVAPLLPRLRDPEREARRQAAAILAGLRDPAAVPPLVAALADPDEALQRQVEDILVAMDGPAVPALLAYLRGGEYPVRRGVAGILGRIGDTRAVLPLLGAHADPTMRSWVTRALVQIGALAPVAAALHDPDPAVRLAAAEALGEMGSPAALTPLLVALKDPEREVRWGAARSLGTLQEPIAVPHLLAALRDREDGMRRAAADALAAMGGPAVSALVPLLKDRDAGMRRAAAAILGRIRDPRAIPALVSALRERDEEVRGAVKEALASLGAPAVQALLGHARGGDAAQRRTVAEILGELEDAEGIGWLLQALGDPDADVRAQAAVGLGRQKAVRGIPPLLAALKDPDGRVRARATAALGEIGLPAAGALTAALGDAAVQPSAIQALVAMGSLALEPLVAALAHPRAEVRGGAADALGELGEEAAIPALVATVSDAEPSVQWRAVCALEMFGEDVAPAHEAVQAFIAARRLDLAALAADRRGALKRGQEWPLILALERHGTREMAEELLAAGSPRVRAAAERWARMRGYAIAPAPKRAPAPGKARPPRRAPR